MNVLIVNPPTPRKDQVIREGRCMQSKASWASLWAPVSLAYLGASIRDAGNQVVIKDCVAERISLPDLASFAEDFGAEFVVYNTAFPTIHEDIACLERLERSLPDAFHLVIGMYPTLLEREFFVEFPAVQYAISGEPEWLVPRMVETLKNEGIQAVEELAGLMVRRAGEVVIREPQNYRENDLDALPFPARDLIDNSRYRLPTNLKKFTLLTTSKGCPHQCTFCLAREYYGTALRKRDPVRVVDEIEECISVYGIEDFLFWGESFTLDQRYAEAICDEIVRRNLRIEWSATSRVDTLSQGLLHKMKQAGCILLGLGIESFDQKQLDASNKRVKIADIERALTMAKAAGLNTMGHILLGLPGQDRASALDTIDKACKSSLTYAQFYCATPWPKTEFGELAERSGWIEEHDYSKYELANPVMGNGILSADEIGKLRRLAYRKFYFRPTMAYRIYKDTGFALLPLLSVSTFTKWIFKDK